MKFVIVDNDDEMRKPCSQARRWRDGDPLSDCDTEDTWIVDIDSVEQLAVLLSECEQQRREIRIFSNIITIERADNTV